MYKQATLLNFKLSHSTRGNLVVKLFINLKILQLSKMLFTRLRRDDECRPLAKWGLNSRRCSSSLATWGAIWATSSCLDQYWQVVDKVRRLATLRHPFYIWFVGGSGRGSVDSWFSFNLLEVCTSMWIFPPFSSLFLQWLLTALKRDNASAISFGPGDSFYEYLL